MEKKLNSNSPRQKTFLGSIKPPKEESTLEKTGEFIVGETRTDDGSGAPALRFPNEIDDFISSDEISF